MDLRSLQATVNQLYNPLEKLLEFKNMNWPMMQVNYQTIVERIRRIIENLDENHDQTLLFPFKPTGMKSLYPNVYLRSKPEPFIEEYVDNLQGVIPQSQYDSTIDAALLLFEE